MSKENYTIVPSTALQLVNSKDEFDKFLNFPGLHLKDRGFTIMLRALSGDIYIAPELLY